MTAGKPVRSSSAVEQFVRFLPHTSTAHADFMEANARVVHHLQHATTWPMIFRSINAARGLGEDLGEQIGVSAELPLVPPHVDDGWAFKASGAGNERAVILATDACRRRIPTGAVALSISEDGLRCDYDIATAEDELTAPGAGAAPQSERTRSEGGPRRLAAPTAITRAPGPYPASCVQPNLHGE
jgi:hypothetical protein